MTQFSGFIFGAILGLGTLLVAQGRTGALVPGYHYGDCPGGPTTSLQFNSNGVCGGSPDLTWNGVSAFIGPDRLLNTYDNNVSGISPAALTVDIDHTGADQVSAIKFNAIGSSSMDGTSIGGVDGGAVTSDDSTHDFGNVFNYVSAYHQGSGNALWLQGLYIDVEAYPGSNGPGSVTNMTGLTIFPYVGEEESAATQIGIDIGDIAGASTNYAVRTGAGAVLLGDLKNTGSAAGKKVVCVDTETGQLYASSAGDSCTN